MKTPAASSTREQLLDGVWGHDVYVDDGPSTSTSAACDAAERGRSRDPIRTVRGAGYAFNEQLERA